LVVLAAGGAMVCAGVGCAPAQWELRVLAWFAEQRAPWLDVAFTTATWLGSLWLLLPLALGLAGALVVRGHRSGAARFAAAFGGAVALSYVTKLLVARERPFGLEAIIAMPGDLSFPSGHTMQITAFALAAVLMVAPAAHRAPLLALALTVIIVVSASRLYLQVHFPSDVIAGAAAAALWVLGIAVATRGRRA
jgi:undecaprenyl-diphosphatase